MKKEYLIGGVVALILLFILAWYIGFFSPSKVCGTDSSGYYSCTTIDELAKQQKEAHEPITLNDIQIGQGSVRMLYDKYPNEVQFKVSSQKAGVFYKFFGNNVPEKLEQGNIVSNEPDGILNIGDNILQTTLLFQNSGAFSDIQVCFSRQRFVDSANDKVCKVVSIPNPTATAS